MKHFGLRASIAGLLLLPLVGCSGSGSSENTGTMFIETCSLGCSSGQGGFQVSCNIVNAFLNQEISITFTEPVDPLSVNSQTFQLIDVISGLVPVGTRFVDPSDPRKLIFRPSVTFDVQGAPTFGFTPDTTYRITIPGIAQNDPGPFIRSTAGKSNKSRMQCDIHTGQTVVDPVPGPPQVTLLVDQSITATPDPDDVLPNVIASGAVDVSTGSDITFVFNDVMNPATLASPLTHQAAFVTIETDGDGDLLTSGDRTPLFGTYEVDIDLNLLRTTMVFTPADGLPSGGDPSLHPDPRKILVTIPAGVQDLAGNSIGLVTVAFTPEVIDFPAAILPDADGENFADTSNLNAVESGADWGGGRLTRGYGGGSGRLGLLHLRQGQTVTLNTDSQVFPLTDVQGGLPDILNNYVGAAVATPITITDGQFEFSSITVEPGATLTFTGSKPARLFSRGPVTVFGSGRIDVRGTTPANHDSSTPLGQTGGAGGPNGGAGGDGGDRKDSGGTNLIAIGGVDIGSDASPNTPGVDIDAADGVGVGNFGGAGSGPGGDHFPAIYPTSSTNPGPSESTFVNAQSSCNLRMVSQPGAGGAYSTSGTAGVAVTPNPTTDLGNSNLPPLGSGSSAIALEPADPQSGHLIRRLLFELGFLRGGAGGGGGGGSLFDTQTINILFPCGSARPLQALRDHSGAGGGGGGGALQLVSGKTMTIGGQILASGGFGGSALLVDPDLPSAQGRKLRAAPGGGGSGGAIKLQGLVLAMDSSPGNPHIVIRGGGGGTNLHGSTGGEGGIGLTRLEDTTGLITRVTESPKIDPFDPDHINPGTGLVESEGWVSVGNWIRPRVRPESYSGAVSCWMRPPGSFFQLEFTADDPLATDPELKFGWNMDVIYQSTTDPVELLLRYRGPDPASPFVDDLETVIGNELNHDAPVTSPPTGSYFAVRFQGAKSNGPLTDPCDVDLTGSSAQIALNSLTPWVKHPAELNSFQPRPNMVRFAVVFDFSMATPNSVSSFVKGVSNLRIRTQPD